MQKEKLGQMVGWLFDQMSGQEDYMVRLYTTTPSPSGDQGIVNLYRVIKGGHAHFASRVDPDTDLMKFAMWLFVMLGQSSRDVAFNPRTMQSTEGRLDFCGQTAYYWLQSYPENEGWACEIHFSFKVKPSAVARNRMEATRIVREAKITAELSSDALMQVADALGSKLSKES